MLVKNSRTFILNMWYSEQKQQLCGQQQVNSKTDSQVYTVYWRDEGSAPAAMLVQYHTPALPGKSSDVFSFSSLLSYHIWKNTCIPHTCYLSFLAPNKSERKSNSSTATFKKV